MLLRINEVIRRVRDDGERGIAMILVIGVTSVMAIMVVAAISLSIGSTRTSRFSADWNASLAAAYAGVEEYQSRLAAEPTYYKFGNPASTFRGPEGQNPVVTLPNPANPAFGLGATGTWASVPGTTEGARFRYEVDNSSYTVNGRIRLRSTGNVGGELRSIVADLKQTGFVDFLYFTDYEIQDPAQSGAPASCEKYAWQGRSTQVGLCGDISFGVRDVIDGPVHSNDSIRACNSKFLGEVTTSYNPPSGPRYVRADSNNNSCSGATFSRTNDPAFLKIQPLPASNSQIKKETRFDLPETPNPGCLYTGPTRIKFNSDGTMTVRSPWTKETQVSGEGSTAGRHPAACGSPGVTGLGSSGGVTVPVPQNNVVYVQSVPSVSTDVNYTGPNSLPTGHTCKGANGITDGNGLGFPLAGEVVPASTPYACRAGDVFVEGQVNGNLSVNAENFIFITEDVTYVDERDDTLGFVATNAILVWNPVRLDNGTYKSLLRENTGDYNRTIQAAMLSVAHTFQVQNYNRGGDRGTLNIRGAIGQKFRGTVATFSGGNIINGYAKSYRYDARFKYVAPPKYLSPVSTTYGVSIWVEVEPIFTAEGLYR